METLYVSDLDGTLLGAGAKPSPYTIEVLNRLICRGVRISFATARSLSSASAVTAGIHWKLPVIVYNGAFVRDPETGRTLFSCSFTKEETRCIAALFHQFRLSPLVYSFLQGEERVSWVPGMETPGVIHYLNTRKGDKRLRPASRDMLFSGAPFYFTCIGTREQLAPAAWELRQTGFRCTLQREIYRDEYWLELMPQEATKANALLRIKEMLHCSRTVVFGDSSNDLPLFQAANECYAVENAVPELKKLADGILPSNFEDGVAHWLEEHAAP